MIAKTAVYRILAKRTRADISVSLVAKESDIQQVEPTEHPVAARKVHHIAMRKLQ